MAAQCAAALQYDERVLETVNQITVVMALYKPNLKWLAEELISIEKQTYRNFSVIAWNDCPEDIYDYDSFFKKYLVSIPFQIYTGKENRGSNGAFAALTELVKTPYIAYCDQDDIWCEDKLEVLLCTMKSEKADLVCSDMMVIDGDSKKIASCISEVRPRQIFYPGENALEHLLAKNFVTGCTVLMKTDVAQAALPFPDSVFHDWWLAIYTAAIGKIAMAPKPLMKYRIYGGNQSAVLAGIYDKESYYKKRILTQFEFVKIVAERFSEKNEVQIAWQWMQDRKEYFNKPNTRIARRLLSQRKNNKWTTYFELLLPFMPNWIFVAIVKLVKNGVL